MLVFIDESGDPGLKFERSSSLFFVVTAVLFTDRSESAQCQRRIESLRQELRLPERFEFRFSSAGHFKRCRFFEAVSGFGFSYYSFVLNKRKLTGDGFRAKESLYKYPVRMLFQDMAHVLRDAKVVMDRCGDHDFRKQMVRYLNVHVNRKLGPERITAVVSERSHNNPLIQWADMVCGAVARSFTEKRGAAAHRDTLRRAGREKQVRFWPR